MQNNALGTTRDPRVDPQPGDVLQKFTARHGGESRSYIERSVTQRWNTPGYEDRIFFGVEGSVLLPVWRKWAKGAKVIHAA